MQEEILMTEYKPEESKKEYWGTSSTSMLSIIGFISGIASSVCMQIMEINISFILLGFASIIIITSSIIILIIHFQK